MNDVDLTRGRKVARSRDWVSNGRLRENIAKAIAEEREAIRTEMLGRVARTEAELEKTLATIKRIWSIK
jgi:hypothetical protein